MSNISRVSLQDTLYLMQMARESHLARGQQVQAANLTPAVEQMKKIVATSNQAPAAPAASGILGQSDFKRILEAKQAQQTPAAPAATPVSQVQDRNRLVMAMASAKMSDVDIARQLGITRDEVRLVLNVQNKNSNPVRW